MVSGVLELISKQRLLAAGRFFAAAIAPVLLAGAFTSSSWAEETAPSRLAALPEEVLEATPEESLTVFYEFFIGGVRLGQINLTAQWDRDRYQIDTSIRTQGLADTLFQGRYRTSAKGVLDGNRVRPRRYISDFETSEDRQSVDLTFNETEPTSLVAKPPYNLAYPVARALKRLTVDPLSAYLYLVMGSSVKDNRPCGEALPIFDGKRRYDFKLTYVKDIRIRTNAKGSYKGPGYICDLQYSQVAGFKPRDKGAKPFPVVRTTVARIDGGRYLVPIKMVIQTPFGSIVGTASRVSLEQRAAAADKS